MTQEEYEEESTSGLGTIADPERLYEYADALVGLARVYLRDRDYARDLVHDVMVKALIKMRSGGVVGKGYLYASVKFGALNHNKLSSELRMGSGEEVVSRVRVPDSRGSSGGDDYYRLFLVDDESHVSHVNSGPARIELQDATLLLTEEETEAFNMWAMGYDVRESAEILSQSKSTHFRIRRSALNKLQDAIRGSNE